MWKAAEERRAIMIRRPGGYMWLHIHRPFEVWPAPGSLQLERAWMAAMVAFRAVPVDKSWIRNRLNFAFLAFGVAMTIAGADDSE
jgi:hypothetical protein